MRFRNSRFVFRILAGGVLIIATGFSFLHADSVIGVTMVLRQSMSTRALAMGEAFTAVISHDVNSLWYNPAGVSEISQTEVIVSAAKSVLDTYYAGAGLGLRVSETSGLGVAYTMFNGGNIEINSVDGSSEIISAQKEELYIIDYGLKLSDKLRAGAGLKLFNGTIANQYRATATIYDIGILYKIFDNKVSQLNLGLSALNLGSGITYIKQKDSLPTTERLGISYVVEDKTRRRITLAIDILQTPPAKLKAHIGTEYALPTGFTLRGGYKIGYDSDSVTAGFGYQTKNIKLDYAIAMMGSFDYTHRLTLGLKIGK